MSANIDRLSNKRIQIVTCLGLSYLFIQTISLSFVAEWTGWSDSLLDGLENIGLAIYILGIASLFLLARKAQRIGGDATTALYDELVKYNANQALQFGYKVVFSLAIILFILNQEKIKLGFEMTAEDVAGIIVAAALVAPYFRFAYLESRDA